MGPRLEEDVNIVSASAVLLGVGDASVNCLEVFNHV